MTVTLFPKKRVLPKMDLEGTAFLLTDVSASLGRFFHEYYRGVYTFSVENETDSTAGVELNPTALGTLLRLLFRENYWTGPLGISLSASMSTWQLKIDLPKGEVPSRTVLSDYVKQGRKTGLSCRTLKWEGKVCVILEGKVSTPPSSVFAKDRPSLFDLLSKIFRQE